MDDADKFDHILMRSGSRRIVRFALQQANQKGVEDDTIEYFSLFAIKVALQNVTYRALYTDKAVEEAKAVLKRIDDVLDSDDE